MLVILFVITLFRTFCASMPIIPNNIIINVNPRDESHLRASSVDGKDHGLRTRFDIIWSCVATLFICTWVAIHPNVPPREGHIRSFWRRMKLMLWTLLVPELILVWAYKQWAAARYVAELFKDEGWTPTHGHFLIMGGFSLVRAGDTTSMVLDYKSFFELLKVNPAQSNEPVEIVFPTITAAEIQDKARGDFLSKAIAILQSIWFIVQCIARGKQGLALTELELVTLALASLNGVMYYFWWDKPLGVNEPIKVYLCNVDAPQKVVQGAGRQERFQASLEAASQLSFVERYLLKCIQRMLSAISQFARHFPTMLSSSIHRQLSSISLTIKIYVDDRREMLHDVSGYEYLWFLYLPIGLLVFFPIVALADLLFEIGNTTDIDHNAPYVPTFYAPLVLSARHRIFFIVTTIFGALHLIAWQFHFPSHIEQLLWRVGSCAITIIPVMVFLIPYFFERILKKFLPEMLKSVVGSITILLCCVGLVAYLLARICLLTQAVMLLRRQPDSAFYAINWSLFLPHI